MALNILRAGRGLPVPVNTVAPLLGGSTTTGGTATVDNGTWTNSPTGYTYQWFSNASPIALATANSHVLQVGEEGLPLDCVVTASNAAGAGIAQASNTIIPTAPGSVPVLTPTGSWNGTPGSAYVGLPGNVPAQDPTRTTAKPSLRMASAWGARISGSLYRIYVDAECAGLATGTSFGIATLNGYLEGGSGAATFGKYTYPHPDPAVGGTVSVQCYAFDIDVASCVAAHGAGGVDFYAEAIPVDTTMQKRVIGPFRFYPRATQYSGTYDVGSGQTYATRKLALTAAVANNEEAPLILYHTNGANYEMEDCSTIIYTGLKGFITEKTTGSGVAITLSRAVFPAGQSEYSTASLWFPGPDGSEWGPGVTLDLGNVGNINNTNQVQGDGLSHYHRMNGCTLTNSFGLASYHWNGRPRPSGTWTTIGFFEDCTVSNMVGGITGAFVARNVSVKGNLRELASNTYYQNRVFVDGWDAWTFWSPVTVMTLAYSNGAHVGSLSITGYGNNDQRASLHFFVDSVETHTITLGCYNNDPNFSATQVAATINAFGDGWTAVKVLDGPSASFWAGVNGIAGQTTVPSSPVNILTAYDFHQDYWHTSGQVNAFGPYTTGPVEGTILRFVNIRGETRKTFDGSNAGPAFLRLAGGGTCKDLSVLECASTICFSVDGGPSDVDNIYIRGLTSGSEGYTPSSMGSYARMEACTGNLYWNSASPIPSPAFINCFLYAESTVYPTTQPAISSAPHSGNVVTQVSAGLPNIWTALQALYVSYSAGDFRPAPAQALAVTGNKRTRTTALDGAGNTFAVPDAIGQLALAQSAVVWPT